MIEKWKPIPGFRGYDASSQGNIRSYRTMGRNSYIASTPQRILGPGSDPAGYLGVNLRRNGKTYHVRIATLVMLTFVGPRPDGLEICHGDSNRQNNQLNNLRYDTKAGNEADLSETARHARGGLVLTDEQVIELRQRYATNTALTCKQLGIEYGVREGTIQRICSGNCASHLPGPINTRRVSKTTINIILRRLRFQSAASLAREYGVHESTISRWRKGTRRQDTPDIP